MCLIRVVAKLFRIVVPSLLPETPSGNKKCGERTPLTIPLGRLASHRYRMDSPTQYGSVFWRILLCREAEIILCRPFWVNAMLFQWGGKDRFTPRRLRPNSYDATPTKSISTIKKNPFKRINVFYTMNYGAEIFSATLLSDVHLTKSRKSDLEWNRSRSSGSRSDKDTHR